MPAESLPPPRPAPFPPPGRKQVTVLFCDVVDYTSRAVSLDPEELADEIRVFQTLCAEIVARHHGHVANFLGDGILALFGHPCASEFDPEHAARAGMGMVERIQRNNASQQWRGRDPIHIRVGIATGLVVVGERGGGGRDQDELIFGEAPNLAARLQGLAEPNTVVTALRTRRLIGGAFKFSDLGEHRIKGFKQPLSAWKILHESTFQKRSTRSLKRAATRFVSRQSELRRLREGHAATLRGSCRIIHLRGDPGIGKSRLLRAFEKTIRKQDLHRLRITCSPYFRNSPFQPIIDETHCWLQIDAHDAPAVKQESIRAAMLAIELANEDEHALFNQLLAIPMSPPHAYLDIGADEKHRRTVEALATFVIRLSWLRPLLLVVEDLHWADPSTLEVIARIIARADGEQLFAVLTSRTGFAPLWPSTHWVADMRLERLNADESARLIAAVIGNHHLPAALKQTLIRKSGGVPLFLEETSRHLLERIRLDQTSLGQPRPEQTEHYHICEAEDAGGLYGQFSIPDTLQDSLNARLDQLGSAKAFAQLAAVFGSDFRYSLISRIADDNDIDADASMDALLEADLLAVTADPTEDRYGFRHAMFQEAAYHSLLKKTRQRYHAQIVELLQQDDPAIERQHPELLAYHYSRAERADRAVDLWLRAGERGIAQAAIEEALGHLTQGLKLVGKLPGNPLDPLADNRPDYDRRSHRELALLLNLGVALTARSGYHGDPVTRAYQRALVLAEAAGNVQQTWTALYGLWRCWVSRAEFSKSVRVSVKLKALSEQSGDSKLMMAACGLQGMTRMVTGKLAAAERLYDQAVKLYDQNRDKHIGVRFGQDPYVTIQGLGAVNKLMLNKTAAASAEIARSVAVARAIGHPYTVAETLRVAAMYQQIAGDFEPLKALAEETVGLARTYGFEGLLAAGNIFLAFYRCVGAGPTGHEQAALIERNLQRYEDNYGMLFLPYFHAVLAEARLAIGACAAAMQAADLALAMVDRYGEEWSRAPLLGIKARAAAQGGLASAAEIARWRQTAMESAAAPGVEFVRRRFIAG